MLRYDDYSCAYIFERLLSYVFNQINNFIMVLFETVSQKTKIRDSETSRPKIRETETRRNTRKRDFETRSKRLQDSEIGTKISETLNFPSTIRHPSRGKGLQQCTGKPSTPSGFLLSHCVYILEKILR